MLCAKSQVQYEVIYSKQGMAAEVIAVSVGKAL